MARAQRGDVWQVDMGIAGKVRPCLLLTDYPLMTSWRWSRFCRIPPR